MGLTATEACGDLPVMEIFFFNSDGYEPWQGMMLTALQGSLLSAVE